jgi:uncharacterized protein YcaQ
MKLELFKFQKQALTWMKYREHKIEFTDLFESGNEMIIEKNRVLSNFYCQIELIDGSFIY